MTADEIAAIRERVEKAAAFGDEMSAEAGAAMVDYEDAMTPQVALALLSHVASLEARLREVEAERDAALEELAGEEW